MHTKLLIMLSFISTLAIAQIKIQPVERKGFVIGLGLGAGTLSLNAYDTLNTTFATTIPNIKVGYMLNKRLALLAVLPGANYKYHTKPRGFEAFQVAGQYWVKEKWWILGGTGLTFDAPAFYTVKDPKKADFFTGLPSFSLATGYEIYHRKRFTIDLQYRFFYGKSNISNSGQRQGISNLFIVGLNWY